VLAKCLIQKNLIKPSRGELILIIYFYYYKNCKLELNEIIKNNKVRLVLQNISSLARIFKDHGTAFFPTLMGNYFC